MSQKKIFLSKCWQKSNVEVNDLGGHFVQEVICKRILLIVNNFGAIILTYISFDAISNAVGSSENWCNDFSMKDKNFVAE